MKKFLSVLIVFLFMTSNVSAMEVPHFYSESGENVTLKDDVDGSLALAGNILKNDKNVNGIAFMAGNDLEFTGKSEYLALAGNTIKIAGDVSKDAFIAGNSVNISGNLNRDVIVFASSVIVSGNIDRNVSIYASSVALDGANINGSVKIVASSLTVTKNSNIGNISYPSDADVNIESGAHVGVQTKTDAIKASTPNLGDMLIIKLFSFGSIILTFALLSLVLGRVFESIQKNYEKMDFNKGIELFTKGLVFLILIPIISLLLFMIGFGFASGLLLIALYVIFIYLSKIFAGYLLGYKIWQKYGKKDINVLLIGILGLFIIAILNLIPGVSMLVSIFTLFIGLGIICDLFKRS